MLGRTAKVRTAVVSVVAATLAVVLGATFWPASGHDVGEELVGQTFSHS